jgi:ubiquinone/menaquinone biosynthesis C-methylase UbiE
MTEFSPYPLKATSGLHKTPSRVRLGTTRNSEVNPFDSEAARYDAWFDSPDGQRIFVQEAACLRELIGDVKGRWLEVGVGTGRFARSLGVKEGVDPSRAALEIAAARGIRTQVGCGEDLPYPDSIFDGILMVVTICYLADPIKAFRECQRVLKGNGRLVVGLVPSDSPWGKLYAREAHEGHLFYSAATFYTCRQVVRFATHAGFTLNSVRSCLFTLPGDPVTYLSPRKGLVTNAGFVALEFAK